MTTMKRTMAIFICMAIFAAMIPAMSAGAVEFVDSGTCGEDLTWSFDTSTGVLTISGMGNMEDYSWDVMTPWYENRTSIEFVIIEDNVTNVGNYAFYDCTGLKSAVIGNSVTSIGDYAFESCAVLTDVTMGDSVTSIGDSAFCDCSGLTNITIDNSVTSIGEYAFWNCGITSVTIPDSTVSIGAYAFANCDSLENVTIPDNVMKIGSGIVNNTAYYKDESNWEDSVLYIGKHLIAAKASLEGDYSIKSGTLTIGGNAFYACEGLTNVTIPGSVISVGDYAFYSCSGLTNVTIPNSVTSIGDSVFQSNGNLNISVDSNNLCYSSIDGVLFSKNQTEIIAYAKDALCPQYVIPDSVTSIGNYAFSGCWNLTSVTMGDGVTSVGEFAFYGCNALTSMVIGDSVTSIGEFAFYACYGIESIVIGNSVTSIGALAFWYCSALTSVTIPDSMISIGEYAFSGCSGLTSVTIGNGMTSIEDYVFSGCSGLMSVTIPDSVTIIGDIAFDSCTSLTDVYYGGSEANWENISIGEYNECLTNATIHFNSTMPTATQSDNITVTLNGSAIVFDQQPVIVNGRTLVPLRAIFEALGASVEWNGETQTVTAEKDTTSVIMTVGETQMYVNGEAKTLDTAPQLINSRTLVPARAIAEAFGCNVDWNNETRTVVITQ